MIAKSTTNFLVCSAMTLTSLVAAPLFAQSNIQPTYQPSHIESKTYLINGLASAIPFIGYGMANLKKKLQGASLYSYVSPVEGSVVIQPKILREIRQLHKRNRDIQINLIGISYGATMVTSISAILARENIPVNYLGVVDGRPLTRIHSNVRRVDNFTCSFIDCIGVKLRMANGNNATQKVSFKFRSTHINLGNNDDMHNRVIQQISTYVPGPENNAAGQQNQYGIDRRPVSAIKQSR